MVTAAFKRGPFQDVLLEELQVYVCLLPAFCSVLYKPHSKCPHSSSTMPRKVFVYASLFACKYVYPVYCIWDLLLPLSWTIVACMLRVRSIQSNVLALLKGTIIAVYTYANAPTSCQHNFLRSLLSSDGWYLAIVFVLVLAIQAIVKASILINGCSMCT